MFALLTELRPDPWYHPRYAQPFLGMKLGKHHDWDKPGPGCANDSLVREGAAVEACLALGGTRHQALQIDNLRCCAPDNAVPAPLSRRRSPP